MGRHRVAQGTDAEALVQPAPRAPAGLAAAGGRVKTAGSVALAIAAVRQPSGERSSTHSQRGVIVLNTGPAVLENSTPPLVLLDVDRAVGEPTIQDLLRCRFAGGGRA